MRPNRTGGLLVIGGLLLAVILQPAACHKDPGDDPIAKSLGQLLEDTGPMVIVPTLDRAHTAALDLVAKTAAWAGGDPLDEEARTAAQQSWRALMGIWQEAEVMQIGPAASSLTAVAGAGLRDEIYSWPTTSPCRVDQETVDAVYGAPGFISDSLVNVYGLDALETLLFAEPGVNACDAEVDINAEGSWEALGVAGVQGNRADYAAVLAVHTASVLEDLQARWTGGFSTALATAGESSSPYESPESGLNAIFDALYYLELETQDAKLSEPLGKGDCTDACASLVETPLSSDSELWIKANLAGFRLLFTGGEGTGMDDSLRDAGHADLADAMMTALDQADAAALALTVPIEVAAAGDPAPALALLDAIGGVTDLLEGDIARSLALTIPSEAAGDLD